MAGIYRWRIHFKFKWPEDDWFNDGGDEEHMSTSWAFEDFNPRCFIDMPIPPVVGSRFCIFNPDADNDEGEQLQARSDFLDAADSVLTIGDDPAPFIVCIDNPYFDVTIAPVDFHCIASWVDDFTWSNFGIEIPKDLLDRVKLVIEEDRRRKKAKKRPYYWHRDYEAQFHAMASPIDDDDP